MNSNISSRMMQVPFFYSLTLTFIFKVKILKLFLFCKYLANGKRQSKDCSDRKPCIYHRMTPPRVLYILTTYIVRSRIFKCEYLNISTDLTYVYIQSQYSNRSAIRCTGTIKAYLFLKIQRPFPSFPGGVETRIVSFLANCFTNCIFICGL